MELFEKKQALITFDLLPANPKKTNWPIHLDPLMGNFGSKVKSEFGGYVCGGFSGLVVNLNNDNVYRITTQQIVDFVADLEDGSSAISNPKPEQKLKSGLKEELKTLRDQHKEKAESYARCKAYAQASIEQVRYETIDNVLLTMGSPEVTEEKAETANYCQTNHAEDFFTGVQQIISTLQIDAPIDREKLILQLENTLKRGYELNKI